MAKAKHIKCERCGTDVIQATRGRARKTCTQCAEHRAKAKRRPYHVCLCGSRRWKQHAECDKCRRIKQCIRCGSNYIHSGQSGPSAHTCSTECRDVIKIRLRRLRGCRATRACSFCGSVSIVPARTNQSERDAFYCDIECCGDHKRFLYVQAEYQDRIGKTERDRVAKQKATERNQRRKKLHAGWSCCIGCGVARKDRRSRMCEACTQDVQRQANARYSAIRYRAACTVRHAVCEHCKKRFKYTRHISKHAERKFCSKKCSARQRKSDRSHRMRTNGPSDTISLIKLARKHGWKCAACGIKCHKPDGSYRIDEATIDHVLPVSKGGTHTWGNVQLLCRQCNCAVKVDRVEPGTQLMLAMEW